MYDGVVLKNAGGPGGSGSSCLVSYGTFSDVRRWDQQKLQPDSRYWRRCLFHQGQRWKFRAEKFSENSATGDLQYGYGAAIYAADCAVSIANCEFSGNTIIGEKRGVWRCAPARWAARGGYDIKLSVYRKSCTVWRRDLYWRNCWCPCHAENWQHCIFRKQKACWAAQLPLSMRMLQQMQQSLRKTQQLRLAEAFSSRCIKAWHEKHHGNFRQYSRNCRRRYLCLPAMIRSSHCLMPRQWTAIFRPKQGFGKRLVWGFCGWGWELSSAHRKCRFPPCTLSGRSYANQSGWYDIWGDYLCLKAAALFTVTYSDGENGTVFPEQKTKIFARCWNARFSGDSLPRKLSLRGLGTKSKRRRDGWCDL